MCVSGAIHAAITELNQEQGWFDAQDQEEEDEYGTLWNSLSSRWSSANPCNAEEGLVSFNDKEGSHARGCDTVRLGTLTEEGTKEMRTMAQDKYTPWMPAIRDRAIELLEIGWTQGVLAVYTDGSFYGDSGDNYEEGYGKDYRTPTPEEGACQWCLGGAVMAATREVDREHGFMKGEDAFEEYDELWLEFSRQWKEDNVLYVSPVGYNDGTLTTRDDVIGTLRRMKL